jgi:hypothetical protein
MPETWELLLSPLTQEQVSKGFDELCKIADDFPPNAAQFKNLCLGLKTDKNGHDITHQHQSAAYLSFNDPKHPSYQAKQIESSQYKSRRKKAARSALDGMKGLLADVQDSVPLNGKMSDEEVKALIEQDKKDAAK